MWNAQAVVMAWHGGKVAGKKHHIFRVLGFAQEGDNAVVSIAEINPFKALPISIDLIERWFALIELVEVAHKLLEPLVWLILQEMPVQALIESPFTPLPKLTAHKEQLLAWVPIHKAIQRPQVSEFLPEVARHLIQHRALAMHDFIMRKRQNEVF